MDPLGTFYFEPSSRHTRLRLCPNFERSLSSQWWWLELDFLHHHPLFVYLFLLFCFFFFSSSYSPSPFLPFLLISFFLFSFFCFFFGLQLRVVALLPFSLLFVASCYSFNKWSKLGGELFSPPFLAPMLQPQLHYQQPNWPRAPAALVSPYELALTTR